MLVAELFTMIEIEASADRVWTILTDFARYAEWNPFIRRVDGQPELDRELSIEVELGVGPTQRFTPRVTALRAPRELRWHGRRRLPGALQGEHRFVVEAIGPNRARLVHEERFSGLLVPLYRRRLDRIVLPRFHAMNEALKRTAESDNDTSQRCA